jgi:hypothetical protein
VSREAFAREIKDRNPAKRIEALRKLNALHEEKTLLALAGALRDADVEVRKAAAAACRNAGCRCRCGHPEDRRTADRREPSGRHLPARLGELGEGPAAPRAEHDEREPVEASELLVKRKMDLHGL